MIIVLGIIAATLATSYALMRGEFYEVRVQQNSNRQGLARQAALAGISVAMEKMGLSTWAGVGNTVTGNLTSQDSYSVTVTAGDDSLTSGSSNYSEYPYRVTLLSTGTSIDPNNSQSKATHKIRAVVRLIPRNLATGPSDLANIVNYTWYQSQNDTFQFQVPLHVHGKVRVQGQVNLGGDYQWSSDAANRYLDDLDLMRQASPPDDRPFAGPLEISYQPKQWRHAELADRHAGCFAHQQFRHRHVAAMGASRRGANLSAVQRRTLVFRSRRAGDSDRQFAGRSHHESVGTVLPIERHHFGQQRLDSRHAHRQRRFDDQWFQCDDRAGRSPAARGDNQQSAIAIGVDRGRFLCDQQWRTHDQRAGGGVR